MFEEIEEKEGDTVYASLLEGLRAEPPRSYPYLRLLFEYRLATPVKRVEVGSKGGLQIIFSHPRGYDPLAEKSAALRQARALPTPSRTPEYEALAAELVEDFLPGELPR